MLSVRVCPGYLSSSQTCCSYRCGKLEEGFTGGLKTGALCGLGAANAGISVTCLMWGRRSLAWWKECLNLSSRGPCSRASISMGTSSSSARASSTQLSLKPQWDQKMAHAAPEAQQLLGWYFWHTAVQTSRGGALNQLAASSQQCEPRSIRLGVLLVLCPSAPWPCCCPPPVSGFAAPKLCVSELQPLKCRETEVPFPLDGTFNQRHLTRFGL